LIGALVNGKSRHQVSILDRGLQFGDGLFETLAVVSNQPCLWDYHMQRLQQGCKRLSIIAPEAQLLEREAGQLVGGERQAVLKITITRGMSERGYMPTADSPPTRILSLFAWDGPSTENIKIAVSSRRLGSNPQLAGIKHLNRLDQVLACMECADDVQEALMLDQYNHVIEGMMSNLFFQRGQKLFTPSLTDSGVDGVVRQFILDRAKQQRLEIITGTFTLDQVLQSDALYLSSSLGGIRFVSEVVGHAWQPSASFHPLLRDIAADIFS